MQEEVDLGEVGSVIGGKSQEGSTGTDVALGTVCNSNDAKSNG